MKLYRYLKQIKCLFSKLEDRKVNRYHLGVGTVGRGRYKERV
jgi:hypothetical protein